MQSRAAQVRSKHSTMWPIALIVSALCVTSSISTSVGYKHLHVKFPAINPLNGYFAIPFTIKDAGKTFVKMAHDDTLNVDLYSYPDDPRFSIIFDTYGNIGGLRLGYIKSDLPLRAQKHKVDFSYKFEDQNMYGEATYWGKPLYHNSVLFIDPDTLKAGGRKELPNGVVVEDVYVTLEGQWTKLPKDECDAETNDFNKQGCFLGMGMHYFYKMTPSSECKDLRGVFLMYEWGQLVGVGLTPFGTFTSTKRTWFEDPPTLAVKMIIPNRPKCLTTLLNNYGSSSFHIFFKRFPRTTQCVWPFQRQSRCKKNNKA